MSRDQGGKYLSKHENIKNITKPAIRQRYLRPDLWGSTGHITRNFQSIENGLRFFRQCHSRQRFSIGCFWHIVLNENLIFAPEKTSNRGPISSFFSLDQKFIVKFFGDFDQRRYNVYKLRKEKDCYGEGCCSCAQASGVRRLWVYDL